MEYFDVYKIVPVKKGHDQGLWLICGDSAFPILDEEVTKIKKACNEYLKERKQKHE